MRYKNNYFRFSFECCCFCHHHYRPSRCRHYIFLLFFCLFVSVSVFLMLCDCVRDVYVIIDAVVIYIARIVNYGFLFCVGVQTHNEHCSMYNKISKFKTKTSYRIHLGMNQELLNKNNFFVHCQDQ